MINSRILIGILLGVLLVVIYKFEIKLHYLDKHKNLKVTVEKEIEVGVFRYVSPPKSDFNWKIDPRTGYKIVDTPEALKESIRESEFFITSHGARWISPNIFRWWLTIENPFPSNYQCRWEVGLKSKYKDVIYKDVIKMLPKESRRIVGTANVISSTVSDYDPLVVNLKADYIK